jgi:hypothetical protein
MFSVGITGKIAIFSLLESIKGVAGMSLLSKVGMFYFKKRIIYYKAWFYE